MTKKILLDEEDQIFKENVVTDHNESKSWIDISLPIKKLDLSKAVTVLNTTSVEETLKIFKEQNITCVIIVNVEEEIMGIFTERDIVKRIILENINLANESIEKYMTPKPETLDIEDSLAFALNKFGNGTFRNLPIMVDGKVKFLLSTSDLIYFIARSAAQFTLNLPPDLHKESREINGG